MSADAATKVAPEIALTFTYRFPGDDDAAIAPQSLDEVLDVFDGLHLIDSLDDEIEGRDVTLSITCHPDNIEERRPAAAPRDLARGMVEPQGAVRERNYYDEGATK